MCWRASMVVAGIATLLLGAGCEKQSDDSSQDTASVEQKQESEDKEQKKVTFDSENPASVGMVVVETSRSFDKVVDGLESHVEESEKLSIVATVDHQKNAESAEMELRPTRTYIISSPSYDLRFVKKGLAAGIDYPKKVVVWQTSDETTRVGTNAPLYAVERHGLDRVQLKLALGDQENQLGEIISEATGNESPTFPKKPHELGVETGQGLETKVSENGVSDTFEKLKSLVSEKEGVSVMGTFDFQMVAKSIDRELPPGQLLIVGNPKLGTPLLKASPSVGLDLPQKIFVHGSPKGKIIVSYNSPEYLAERHGISTDKEALDKMSNALDSLTEEACEEITD